MSNVSIIIVLKHSFLYCIKGARQHEGTELTYTLAVTRRYNIVYEHIGVSTGCQASLICYLRVIQLPPWTTLCLMYRIVDERHPSLLSAIA